MAEVCDKVTEGGTWLLPVVLVTGMAGLTAFVATRRWAWAIFLVLPVIPSPLLLVDWDIYVYARTEGCGDQMLQAPVAGAAVVALCAITGLILHWVDRHRAR